MHITWKRSHAEVVSGATAGVVCTLVCSPLDVAKIRMQLQYHLLKRYKYTGLGMTLKTIYVEEGFRGLYRGILPTICIIPLFWASYFPLYRFFKEEMHTRWGYEKSSVFTHISAAVSAGFFVDIFTNPLWLIRTRMITQQLHCILHDKFQTDSYSNIFRTFRTIHLSEGAQAFFKGITASFLGLSHVAVQFPIYESLKSYFKSKNNGTEPIPALILSSAIAKMCASAATYPHEVIRSRMYDSRANFFVESLI